MKQLLISNYINNIDNNNTITGNNKYNATVFFRVTMKIHMYNLFHTRNYEYNINCLINIGKAAIRTNLCNNDQQPFTL